MSEDIVFLCSFFSRTAYDQRSAGLVNEDIINLINNSVIK